LGFIKNGNPNGRAGLDSDRPDCGWLAAKITNAPRGLLRNLIVGLVGSLVGGFLFTKLGLHVVPDFWGELITATIGAVVFLAIWQAIRQA
jgi:uncharacterized membrane protein YeaQ/YmgE (transglycosylase-associated protein family)